MEQVTFDPELGTVVSELRAGWGTRIAVFFLILVFMGLLAAGVSQAEQAPLLLALVGVVTLALCGFTQFVLSASRVRLYQYGIERSGRFGRKRIAWQQLERYQLQIIDTAVIAGAGGGLLGLLVARLVQRAMKPKEVVPNAVWLFDKSGTKLTLAGNVKGYPELVKQLIPSLTEQLFAQLKPVFDSGAPIAFGKKVALQRGVGITVSGAFGRKQVLPLEQAASATLDRAALVIRRSDNNAVWQSLQAASVANLGVLQKFVELAGRRYDEGVPLAWTS